MVIDAVADALVEQCAVDEACNAAYPDLRASINTAMQRLHDAPIPASCGRPEITIMSLFQLIFQKRNAANELRPISRWLPRIITELPEGTTETFDALMAMAPPDPGAMPATLDGLSEDERALIALLIGTATASQTLDRAAATALRQLKDDLRLAGETTKVPEAFDRRASQAAFAMGDKAALTAAVQGFAMLQTMEPARAPLHSWVDAHFTGADRAALLQLVSIMSDEDIARVFDSATRDASKY